MDRWRATFVILLSLALAFTVGARDALAQARAKGKVLLYTSVPQQLATAFTEAFMKKLPEVQVEVYRAGSTEVGRKIAEYSWPKYRAYFDGTAKVRE